MELIHAFGKMGYSLYRKVRGIHNSPVVTNRERKSIGKEHTFGVSLYSMNQAISQLRLLSESVANTASKQEKQGQTVVLKLRYDDYTTITKRQTFPEFIDHKEDIFSKASLLFEDTYEEGRGIRLLGITLTNLKDKTYELITLPLFEYEKNLKDDR